MLKIRCTAWWLFLLSGFFQCANVEPSKEEMPEELPPKVEFPSKEESMDPYFFRGLHFYKTGGSYLWFGDLNQDGKIDVLAGNSPGVIDFIPQTSSQVWQTPTTHVFEADQKLTIGQLADFNQDGKLDLLVTRQKGVWGIDTTWSIALGKGDGTFESSWHDIDPDVDRFRYGGKDAQSRCFGRCLLDLSSASFDINQDGKLDLLLGFPGVGENDWNNELGFIAVLFGNGDATFQETPMIIPIHGKPSSFAFGDLDMDGYLDMVVSHSGFANYMNPGQQIKGVSILYGQADGRFVQTRVLAEEQGHFGIITLVDVNHDHQLDIVLSIGGFHLLLNQGHRKFSPLTSWVKPNFPNAKDGFLWFISQVQVFDMNQDGNVDVVEVAYSRRSSLDPAEDRFGPSNILIYNGDGKGGFSSPQFIPLGMYGKSFYITDLNQDQKPDIIVGGEGFWSLGQEYTGGISLYLNQTR